MSQLKSVAPALSMPQAGWIYAVRRSMGMSLNQLATRLGITLSGALKLEQREKDGNITLNKLREAGAAMGMKFVYGFIPESGTLEDVLMKRAKEIAAEIVSQSAHTMELENQGVSKARLDRAINEMAKELVEKRRGRLWD